MLLAGGSPAPAQQDAGAEHEPEIVPAAVVVDFVHRDVVYKQRQKERDGRDGAVPKPHQEARRSAAYRIGIDKRVGASQAPGQQQQGHCSKRDVRDGLHMSWEDVEVQPTHPSRTSYSPTARWYYPQTVDTFHSPPRLITTPQSPHYER